MKSAQHLIDTLKLKSHPEGGYFKRVYQSEQTAPIGPNDASRFLLTCIYYLLTNKSPIAHLHVNRSDIMHFYHGGAPITYTLVSPTGELHRETLGSDLDQGQKLQLPVPGGWWEASQLPSGEYGLISEAVAPGFDPEDMRFISQKEIESQFPKLSASLSSLCRA